jgi:cyanophycinase
MDGDNSQDAINWARAVLAILLLALLASLTGSAQAAEDEAVIPRVVDLAPTAAKPWEAGLVPIESNFEPAAPVSGSLVICGGGKLPDSVLNRFLELAGGDEARIVVIPTASALADSPEVESKLVFWRRAKVAALDILHTRSRTQANEPGFVRPLQAATGVWFTGGFQWRLADTYLGTAVEKLVHSVLDRGGVVGGTSSGAAIMSTNMIRRGYPSTEVGRGFDFLPGTVIDQHFLKRNRQQRLIDVLEHHPGFVGLGIDEGTALIAQGRRLSVLGESQVVAYLAPSADRPLKLETLHSGDEVDLIAMSRAAVARAKPSKRPSRPDVQAAPDGTLILAGGGDLPPEVGERFIAAAGGPDAPLVVISTAASARPEDEREELGWLHAAGATNVCLLDARSRAEALNESSLKIIRRARGIWFSGGKPWRLVDAYLDSEAEREFHRVLAAGGVIGGTAAGARIQASALLRGTPSANSELSAEGYETGFGFFRNVAIEDRFSEENRLAAMVELKRRRPELIGIGIDERTALAAHGNQLEVLGASHVTLFADTKPAADGRPAFRVLEAGERFDLKTGRRIAPASTTTAAATVASEPSHGKNGR